MEIKVICWKSLIKTQSMKLPRIILIINCSDPWEPGCVRLAIIALLPPQSPSLCLIALIVAVPLLPPVKVCTVFAKTWAACGIVGRVERTEWGQGPRAPTQPSSGVGDWIRASHWSRASDLASDWLGACPRSQLRGKPSLVPPYQLCTAAVSDKICKGESDRGDF